MFSTMLLTGSEWKRIYAARIHFESNPQQTRFEDQPKRPLVSQKNKTVAIIYLYSIEEN